MGFVTNVMEDFENFLVVTLNEKQYSDMHKQEEKLLVLKASIDYRQTDIIYLMKEGYEYSKGTDMWSKKINFDYGKFPGEYRVSIKFPYDYPKKHPTIYCVPLFEGKSGKDYSSHLDLGNGGSVCIAGPSNHNPNSYWKSYMNAKGALLLAYHLITDEISRNEGSRKEIPVEGTVIGEIMKVVDKEVFIKEFLKPHKVKVDKSWTWGEIAHKTSKLSKTATDDLIKYYNKKKR